MITIGIATWMRHDRTLETALHAIEQFTEGTDIDLVIACDSPQAKEWCDKPHRWALLNQNPVVVGGLNRGVAANKNRIFAHFLDNKASQHLFLFEDDCWPGKNHWWSWYLDGHDALKIGAFCFQPEDMYQGRSAGPKLGHILGGKLGDLEIARYQAIGTRVDGMPLLSITRKAAETVGGMHPAFKKVLYGNEHSEFMRRCQRARLVPWSNCTLRGCEEWIHSIDYDEWLHNRGKGGAPRPYGDPSGAELLFKKHQPKGLKTLCDLNGDRSIFHDPHWPEVDETER